MTKKKVNYNLRIFKNKKVENMKLYILELGMEKT